jgi:hypothetical protein
MNTIIVPLQSLEDALIEYIQSADFEELAKIAGLVLGGECAWWGGRNDEFHFYPDDNYTGTLNNFEER